MPQHITLSELQSLIKRGIDDAHPLPYWVTAEISELKVNYSGYCYLELVEKGGANHVPKAKISAVIWRSTYGMIASYFGAATGGTGNWKTSKKPTPTGSRPIRRRSA